MSVLTRYILREVLSPFAIGVFAFTLLFVANNLFKLMDWIVIGGVSGSLVGSMLLSLLPFIMNVTFPMALLLGCIFAFGKLSENNEVQAMLTCGQTYGRVIRPVLGLGLATSLFLLFWCEEITPRASVLQNMTLFRIIEKMSPIAILEESKFSTRLPGKVVYIQKIDMAEQKMHGMAIFDMDGNKIKVAVFSPEGFVRYDSREMTLTLDFKGGQVHVNVESGKPNVVEIDGRIQMVLECKTMMAKFLKDKQILMSLSRAELKQKLAEILAAKGEGKDYQKRLSLVQSEMTGRIVMPFACLVLAAVGAPLAFWMHRGSRGACFVLAISVIMVYYFLMVLGSSLADKHVLSQTWGAWTPNVIVGAVGLVMNLHLARK